MIHVQTNAISPLQKIVTALLGLTMLALVALFSVVMIPVIALTGVIGFAYFYWKTRALRRTMAQAVADHDVIEGEAVVIREQGETKHLN